MIRKATVEDSSRIAEILIFAKRTAYRKIFNNDKVSFGEMQVLPIAMEYIQNPKLLDSIYVYDDDFVKAMINISIEDCAEINELYIDSFFQKQGIGKQMLGFAEEYVCAQRKTRIALWVLEKNNIAIKFYQQNGFIYAGEKKLETGTTEYILKYHKELSKDNS